MFLANFVRYDEEIFKTLFEITNRIEIRKIRLLITYFGNEELKSLLAQIRSLDAENMISDEVSWFICF